MSEILGISDHLGRFLLRRGCPGESATRACKADLIRLAALFRLLRLLTLEWLRLVSVSVPE